jgi:hypothetical protein
LFNRGLIHRRDREIVTNLEKYVKDGSTALLFMGCGHDVPAYLNESWRVIVITAVEIPLLLLPTMPDLNQLRWMQIYRQQSDRYRITSGELDEEL